MRCWIAPLLLIATAIFASGAERVWKMGQGYRFAAVRPEGSGKPGFTTLPASTTGVVFTNRLQGDAFLTNAVAHNGSGVALGDIDGDGRVDIYLCNLQGPNALYRNLGNWRFQPAEMGDAACASQLSTGATFADVDGDGDPDLLVNGIAAGTRLFLNDGQGHFTEAKSSGLSTTASATSMALADMDGDGDLDIYCTHYIDEMHLADPTVRFAMRKRGGEFVIVAVNDQPTSSPRLTNRFQIFGNGRVRELPEVDGFYRNDGRGRFTPIQFERGIFSDADGHPLPPYRDWGLAVMFRDLNGDGAPDLYICNDNASPDRMWLNSGRGTFRAFSPRAFRHTSRSSMGLDVADINRDGLFDIVTVDMFAMRPDRRMMQLHKELPDPDQKENLGEQPRYNRNALFVGRADGTYAETALMAGIAASDWSWCPIFLDVDLDGYEDLVVTTGFSFDVMDQDSSDKIRKSRLPAYQLKRSRQFHPAWPTPNAAFRNRRDGTFEPVGEQWGFTHAAVSNGAAVADLDNDGDLDVVVNNLNEAPSLYRNDAPGARIAVQLRGTPPNTEGIGAKISLVNGSLTQSQEMISGGRYLSGDAPARVFAANDLRPDARLEVQWRNGDRTAITNLTANCVYEVHQSAAKATAPVARAMVEPFFAEASELIKHTHVESNYDDWTRQPLLPHRLSRGGPDLAWFDLNGDGWEDLLITPARGQKLSAFLSEGGRTFRVGPQAAAALDDQTAIAAWRGERGPRLALSVSDFERAPNASSELLLLNGQLLATNTLTLTNFTAGPLALADIDGDGDLDLFTGGRPAPGRYPEPARSFFWINETGKLRPPDWQETFPAPGIVNGATFTDFDGDGAPDLALATEWGAVRLFRNHNGSFSEVTDPMGLGGWTGLWTSIATADFDGDGRLDLVAGNWGSNTAYATHPPGALRLFYGDWNGDGTMELLEAWQSGTNFFPVRDRLQLSSAFPDLTTRFPTHAAFAAATVGQLLGERFATARFVEATHLESTVFLNRGSRFEPIPLPSLAQISPAVSVTTADFDGDGREDIFLSQNLYGVLSEITRDDSGEGLLLRGRGDGSFEPLDSLESGIRLEGEQRAAAPADFNHDGRIDLVVGQNNGVTRLYVNRRATPGIRVQLRGPAANPDGVGAQLRAIYSGGKRGPVRLITAGSGGGGRAGAAQVFASGERASGIWVRWPDGREKVFEPGGENEVVMEYNQN